MEFLSVVMLSFVGCFIALIITLVFLNLIILMSDEDKSKIAEKSKDLGFDGSDDVCIGNGYLVQMKDLAREIIDYD